MNYEPFLYHYGVPGMRWGVINDRNKKFHSRTKTVETNRPHSRNTTVASGYATVKKGTSVSGINIPPSKLTKNGYRAAYSHRPTASTPTLHSHGEGYRMAQYNPGSKARVPKYGRFLGNYFAGRHEKIRSGTYRRDLYARPTPQARLEQLSPSPGTVKYGDGWKKEDIEKGKEFVSSLFDKKWELGIGNFSISVKKKGKISKAIDSGKKWLNNVLKNIFG